MISRRIVFSYNANLSIEYAPKFILHKCPPEFPHPKMTMAHHPYFLDIEVPKADRETGVGNFAYSQGDKPENGGSPDMIIPDYIAQQDINERALDEIVHLINALTYHHIFTYDSRQAWTIQLGDMADNLRYSQEMYVAPDFEVPDTITAKGNSLPLDLFSITSNNGAVIQQVTFQNLLELYFSFEDADFKKRFLNACLVVDKAKKLNHFEQSASYLFLVSAIETLIDYENRNVKDSRCETCNQVQFRVMAKFRTFIDKYGENIEKKKLNEFYTMRSNISHVGQLFQSSYRSSFAPTDQEGVDKQHTQIIESIKYDSFRGIVEMCFATFLYYNTRPKDPSEVDTKQSPGFLSWISRQIPWCTAAAPQCLLLHQLFHPFRH